MQLDLGSVHKLAGDETSGTDQWPWLLYAEWATSRQAYKLDRLNIMGYYKNRGHPASHRLMKAVFAGAGPKKG